MSMLVYKILHLLGLILLFLSLGGLIVAAKSGDPESRRRAVITHGIALVLLLVSGFGLLAKLGLAFPAWAMVKTGIWFLLGGIVVLFRKQPQRAALWWTVAPLLGLAAAYLAIYKPF